MFTMSHKILDQIQADNACFRPVAVNCFDENSIQIQCYVYVDKDCVAEKKSYLEIVMIELKDGDLFSALQTAIFDAVKKVEKYKDIKEA